MENNKITSQEDSFARWYQDVVREAGLAEHSAVRGFMIIKPYGYAIWERIQKLLDRRIKKTGAQNAYFPLLIPQSYIEKEKEHVAGFSPELAVVTHAGGKKLDEPYVIRPTSETMIDSVFAKWVKSYRDLPMIVNQWANVVRWEMRTRLFLRSSEFLWQEGHTCHATEKEALQKTQEMLDLYKDFSENILAIPVITGTKSDSEKFAGALTTLTTEGLMPDGKALQLGTSHMFGQKFAKEFGIQFLNREGKQEYVWQTSWGTSTRVIGGIIMAHGDDKGLVLPPKIAPYQVVIVTIGPGDNIQQAARRLSREIKENGIRSHIDDRDERPGVKFYEWEKKGVPVRLEIGEREIEENQFILTRRDTGEKKEASAENISDTIKDLLNQIQSNLLERQRQRLVKDVRDVLEYNDFQEAIKQNKFARGSWCGSEGCEAKAKAETKATIRAIIGQSDEPCMLCGAPGKHQVIAGKSY